MIQEMADNFLQIGCLILAVGVALSAVISAIRGRPARDEPSE